ncbi:MAG: hypothetical protein CL927_02015 [Deltaproteobacteria bacterium]|nr:hypothetical protein [Deltaproteobacteria bacterium]
MKRLDRSAVPWPKHLWLTVAVLGAGCGDAPEEASALVCGETLCPGGTHPVEVNDVDGGCHAACEPLQDCPSFAFPVMTEDCFSCALLTSRGRSFTVSQPLGRSVNYSTCAEAPEPGGTLTILRYFLDVDLSDPNTPSGRASLVWSDEADVPICTAEFRIEGLEDAGAPPSAEGVDTRVALLHLLDSGLTEPGCISLNIELMAQQVERLDHAWFWIGHSSRWTDWDGQAHSDVVFRYDATDAYDDGNWYPWQQGRVVAGQLQVEALFGTAMRAPLPDALPAEGFERWTWYEGERLCDETLFVVGAEPAVDPDADALYRVVFARGAGSTACTPAIWRTARGISGDQLLGMEDDAIIELATCEISDATLDPETPRIRVDWGVEWTEATGDGTLFLEIP